MKKIFLPLMVMAALAMTGCVKEHQCKCEVTDTTDADYHILTVDGQLKCESITELGVEEKYVTTDATHSLRRTEMHKVSCRDYANK